MRAFLSELKRRNVLKTAVLYIVGAWLILQVVDIMFPALQLPRWTITLVVALQIIGFPIVLVLAWVFDITPEGIRRTGSAEFEGGEHSRRMDLFIVAGLIVAIGLLLYQAFNDRGDSARSASAVAAPEPGSPNVAADSPPASGSAGAAPARLPALALGQLRSVAILPFLNLSDDPANEFFCDGVSEELLNVLAAMPELRVPSRTSTFAFKGDTRELSEIARELEVDYVIEGSVRKSGNQVRVTAQLIDVSSDSHLWSQTYDRDLSDIFAVQDEIAHGVAEALRVKLEVGRGMPLVGIKTSNMQAYELYLRGRQVWRLRRRDALLLAEDLLLQAVELDPEFAHAWADLSVVYLVQSSHNDAGSTDNIRQAELAANQALRLDDSLGRPRAVLGVVAAGKRRYGEAEVLFRVALEREPIDATSRLWYATLLSGLGRTGEAGEQFRIAIEQDSLSGIGRHWLGAHQLQQGDLSAALQSAQRAIELGYEPAHLLAFESLVRLGELDQAEKHLALGVALNGLEAALVPGLMAALRDPAARSLGIAAIASHLSSADQLRMLALLPASPGLADRLAVLEGTQFFTSLPILWDAAFAAGQLDTAFSATAKNLDLLDYWQSSGIWPDHCIPAGPELTCRLEKVVHP